jgi:hypothetical protein
MAEQGVKRKNIGGPRFADPKKPRWLTEAEKEEAAKRKEQAPSNFVSSKEIVFCPYHGGSLVGDAMRCPECRKVFLERRVVKVPEDAFRVVVDSRHWEAHWRRKLFSRVVSPFHSKVVYTAEPHVAFWVWKQVFKDDLDCESYRTPAVKTNIKILETTYAVERICSFGFVNAQKGYQSAKIVNADAKEGKELLMVVPPVEVAHLHSQARGTYITITFGWIKLNKHGEINKAENMPEPAEGWSHVHARCRDLAARVAGFGGNGSININMNMVKKSEEKLLQKYANQTAFLEARQKREGQRAHILNPRPVKRVTAATAALQAEVHELLPFRLNPEYNPYEARKLRSSLQLQDAGEGESIYYQLMCDAHNCLTLCSSIFGFLNSNRHTRIEQEQEQMI